MAEKANYILFHPENKREKVQAQATVMKSNNEIVHDWEGQIFVDSVCDGNEDPFVFNNPWIYSYCHASQLRRNPRRDSFLQPDSKLIFISGLDADNGLLTVDTIFIVGSILKWDIRLFSTPPRELPSKYTGIKNDNNSDLWNKHFKFPFEGQHSKVTYSYEAKLWEDNGIQIQYSYLPLTENQERISIPFSELPRSVMDILIKKKKGKFPVEINTEDIDTVLKLIESKAAIKVLKDIKFIQSLDEKTNKGRG